MYRTAAGYFWKHTDDRNNRRSTARQHSTHVSSSSLVAPVWRAGLRSKPRIVTNSFLLQGVRHLLLVAMHLFLIASCFQ